jgi:hypothetical protein
MNPNIIRFTCRSCRARIKAPVQLGGCTRSCPRCTHTLRVPFPAEDKLVLVLMEGAEGCSLGVAHRR